MGSFLHTLAQKGLTATASKAMLSQKELEVRMQTFIAATRKKLAQNLSIQFITDPREGPVLDAMHNAPGIFRSPELIQFAVEHPQSKGQPSYPAGELARRIDAEGGFYMQYQGEEERRILHSLEKSQNGSGWLVVVCDGHPLLQPHENLVYGDTPQRIAHADFRLPADDGNAEPVLSVDGLDPSPLSAFNTIPDLHEQIQQNPGNTMLIADICSDPKFRGAGAASFLERETFRHIVGTINPSRKFPIKYAVSEIAEVLGVLDAKSQPITFFNPRLFNVVSYMMHTRNRLGYGNVLGQKQTVVRIDYEGRKYGLVINWHVVGQGIPQVS